MQIEQLERQLDDFDPTVRARALAQLIGLGEGGEVSLAPERAAANMHCHTFFSYNGYGYSPTGLAWLGKKLGLRAMGIVDFDVLDGVDEFLGACDAVALRSSTGMETRVFVPEFAEREINSPGEPGIFYHMGIGFTSSSAPGKVQPILESMGQRASERNRGLIERVNAYPVPRRIDMVVGPRLHTDPSPDDGGIFQRLELPVRDSEVDHPTRGVTVDPGLRIQRHQRDTPHHGRGSVSYAIPVEERIDGAV